MYEKFYGFKERPFNVTADPNFLFLSQRHKEAFSHLIYGIKERKGFLAITGEVGTGKTTLCKALLNHIEGLLEKNIKTALILNPQISQTELLRLIVEDLGIKKSGSSSGGLIRILNSFLINELTSGSNVVLIIDEAQNLKPRLLEQVRLLSNLETEKEKLIQIILVGQPELEQKLQSPNLRQLNQRISVRYHILPLNKEEMLPYIRHRLRIAQCKADIVFSDGAIEEIFDFSKGIPRLINMLCDKVLLNGYVRSLSNFSAPVVRECVEELNGSFVKSN